LIIFQVSTGITTTSNTKTSLSVNIPEDSSFTCTFHFSTNDWVRKYFTLVTKGCKTPSVADGGYTPVSELSKVAPGAVLSVSCTNTTKYQIQGNSILTCGNTRDGDTNYYAYNRDIPTCKFMGQFIKCFLLAQDAFYNKCGR